MEEEEVGFSWLKKQYGLEKCFLKQHSFIGSNEKMEITSNGVVVRFFGVGYRVANTAMDHLIFGLKYDFLNLHFLRLVFLKLPKEVIVEHLRNSTASKYGKKIGFLYEFLMNEILDIDFSISGNYVDVLDSQKYITGSVNKNKKWRVNDNLLGTYEFCPIIFKTKEIIALSNIDIASQMEQLRKDYPIEIFKRATQYLYNKETKSSYEIESEMPSPKRIERFISLLLKAGSIENTEMFSEINLTQLQNEIVDERFAVDGFRDFQNYVGRTLPNASELIDYLCPPPQFVISLMNGLGQLEVKSQIVNSVIRASAISFGFVFIHPFEDGNGRLHRFLIHDILVRDKIVSNGLIIPISAHILNNIKEYDAVLENFSKPLLQLIEYVKSEKGAITVTNPHEIESYFRYPDLTNQTIFLGKTIEETLSFDIPNELEFLLRYDELKKAIQEIVDMPDTEINKMILFLHQNKGIFPKRRRKDFAKLTDGEIELMEKEYLTIFEM